MTDAPKLLPRPYGVARACAAWVSRVVLACVFAIGMLGPTSRTLVEAEAEPEPAVEIGEDGEVIAREDDLLRLVRRGASRGGPRWARRLAQTRPPQRVDPTVPSPTPPRWQRPRRAPPPSDEDGAAIG